MRIEPAESEPAPASDDTWLPSPGSDRVWWALLLAVGVSLRVYGFSDHGLWIDEYGTWWTIAGQTYGDCWNRALEIQGQSPFYYLIVRLSVDLLGSGTAALRLPSLLFGIALLTLSYPLAVRVFRDRRIALFALAAFAVNERLIYYSQEARPYALAMFFAACSFYFYASLLERDGRLARVGYVLTTALTYYAHYFFGIVVLVQAVHFLATQPRTSERLRPWITNAGLVALTMAPGLWQVHALFSRRDSLDWISAPSGWLGFLEPAADLLDPLVFGLTGAAALLAWASNRPPIRGALGAYGGIGLLWFAIPVLVFSVVPELVGVHLAHARYLVVAAPAIPLLYAALIAIPLLPAHSPPDTRILARTLRSLPLLIFVISTIALRIVPFVSEQGGFWWFYQHGWKEAVHDIVEGIQPGDLILYRTHFVELDQLVRGEASAATTEFVEWPVLANLPTDRAFALRALPYSDTPQTRAVLRSTIRDAAPARGIWVIGLEVDDPTQERSVLSRAVQLSVQTHGMRAVGRHRYGLVRLVELRRVGSPTRQP